MRTATVVYTLVVMSSSLSVLTFHNTPTLRSTRFFQINRNSRSCSNLFMVLRKGKVSRFDPTRGIGYIAMDDGSGEIYFDRNNINEQQRENNFMTGEIVEFDADAVTAGQFGGTLSRSGAKNVRSIGRSNNNNNQNTNYGNGGEQLTIGRIEQLEQYWGIVPDRNSGYEERIRAIESAALVNRINSNNKVGEGTRSTTQQQSTRRLNFDNGISKVVNEKQYTNQPNNNGASDLINKSARVKALEQARIALKQEAQRLKSEATGQRSIAPRTTIPRPTAPRTAATSQDTRTYNSIAPRTKEKTNFYVDNTEKWPKRTKKEDNEIPFMSWLFPKKEDEADRIAREAEASRLKKARIEAAKLKAENEARIAAEAEYERLRLEVEARIAAEEATARLQAEEKARIEAARLRAEYETRMAAEEETARVQAEFQARIAAEEETKRLKAAEEARLEALKIKAVTDARIAAEAEAARIKAENEARLAAEAETARAKATEKARLEEARIKAVNDARIAAEKEAARLKEEVKARIAAEEETKRLKAEEKARQKKAKKAQQFQFFSEIFSFGNKQTSNKPKPIKSPVTSKTKQSVKTMAETKSNDEMNRVAAEAKAKWLKSQDANVKPITVPSPNRPIPTPVDAKVKNTGTEVEKTSVDTSASRSKAAKTARMKALDEIRRAEEASSATKKDSEEARNAAEKETARMKEEARRAEEERNAAEEEAVRMKKETAKIMEAAEAAREKAKEVAAAAAKEKAMMQIDQETMILQAEKESLLSARKAQQLKEEKEKQRIARDEAKRVLDEEEKRIKAEREQTKVIMEEQAAKLKAEEEATAAAELEAAQLIAKEKDRLAAKRRSLQEKYEREVAKLKTDEKATEEEVERMIANAKQESAKKKRLAKQKYEEEAKKLQADEEAQIAAERNAELILMEERKKLSLNKNDTANKYEDDAIKLKDNQDGRESRDKSTSESTDDVIALKSKAEKKAIQLKEAEEGLLYAENEAKRILDEEEKRISLSRDKLRLKFQNEIERLKAEEDGVKKAENEARALIKDEEERIAMEKRKMQKKYEAKVSQLKKEEEASIALEQKAAKAIAEEEERIARNKDEARLRYMDIAKKIDTKKDNQLRTAPASALDDSVKANGTSEAFKLSQKGNEMKKADAGGQEANRRTTKIPTRRQQKATANKQKKRPRDMILSQISDADAKTGENTTTSISGAFTAFAKETVLYARAASALIDRTKKSKAKKGSETPSEKLIQQKAEDKLIKKSQPVENTKQFKEKVTNVIEKKPTQTRAAGWIASTSSSSAPSKTDPEKAGASFLSGIFSDKGADTKANGPKEDKDRVKDDEVARIKEEAKAAWLKSQEDTRESYTSVVSSTKQTQVTAFKSTSEPTRISIEQKVNVTGSSKEEQDKTVTRNKSNKPKAAVRKPTPGTSEGSTSTSKNTTTQTLHDTKQVQDETSRVSVEKSPSIPTRSADSTERTISSNTPSATEKAGISFFSGFFPNKGAGTKANGPTGDKDKAKDDELVRIKKEAKAAWLKSQEDAKKNSDQTNNTSVAAVSKQDAKQSSVQVRRDAEEKDNAGAAEKVQGTTTARSKRIATNATAFKPTISAAFAKKRTKMQTVNDTRQFQDEVMIASIEESPATPTRSAGSTPKTTSSNTPFKTSPEKVGKSFFSGFFSNKEAETKVNGPAGEKDKAKDDELARIKEEAKAAWLKSQEDARKKVEEDTRRVSNISNVSKQTRDSVDKATQTESTRISIEQKLKAKRQKTSINGEIQAQEALDLSIKVTNNTTGTAQKKNTSIIVDATATKPTPPKRPPSYQQLFNTSKSPLEEKANKGEKQREFFFAGDSFANATTKAKINTAPNATAAKPTPPKTPPSYLLMSPKDYLSNDRKTPTVSKEKKDNRITHSAMPLKKLVQNVNGQKSTPENVDANEAQSRARDAAARVKEQQQQRGIWNNDNDDER